MIKVTSVIAKETRELEEKVTAELYEENPINEEEIIEKNKISLAKGDNGRKNYTDNK